jgi:hypothetical protein
MSALGYILSTWQTFLAHAQQSRPMASVHRQQLCWNFMCHSECFVYRWFCAVHGIKPPLHRHNWLSFNKFQDTECFLIPCPCHVSSQWPPSRRFCTYWYAPFCCVCLCCCTAEFGISGGTYELACISWFSNWTCSGKFPTDHQSWLPSSSLIVCQ